jgi:hypothetical protein
VLTMAIELSTNGNLNVPTLTKTAMSSEAVRSRGKEASDFARKLAEDLMRRSTAEVEKLAKTFDELTFLRSCQEFLVREFGCDIEVYQAGEPGAQDPKRHPAAQRYWCNDSVAPAPEQFVRLVQLVQYLSHQEVHQFIHALRLGIETRASGQDDGTVLC